MKVIKADILGFCFGVRRAVELAQDAILENPEKKIHSLGPLIHNEIVLNELESKGLDIISEEDIKNLNESDVVLIRAHGTSPDIYEKIKNQNCKIIDATCPRVTNSQKLVKKYSQEKDFIIFTGDKNHGEVKSIEGCGKNNFVLVQNIEELKEALLSKSIKADSSVLLLSQTTFSEYEFESISNLVQEKIKNSEIKNTICPATKERQESLLDLCSKVDGIIVIGGKKSANSKRLYQIAMDNCKKAAFIQCAQEIPEEFFKLSSIGITAGASTPDIIIENVISSLTGGND